MRAIVLSATVSAVLIASADPATAQQRSRNYPPKMPGAKVEVYKTVGDVKLNMYIYLPKDHKPTDRRAAVVFFFGGGWRSGTPGQFRPHCEYLAARGMVAMAADYRVSSRHQTKAVQCVEDAKSAVRWIRTHAARLGVDAKRVAAGGGSAGGHIAAATGTIKKYDASDEDRKVSSVPDAMLLFNPAVVLASVEGREPFAADRVKQLQSRMGVEPKSLSPAHHVAKGAPPTAIFHGKADKTVPFWTAELFATRMKAAGNRCELHGYEDQGHGFFNFGRDGNKAYTQTTRTMDLFLASLGFLEGEPTLK